MHLKVTKVSRALNLQVMDLEDMDMENMDSGDMDIYWRLMAQKVAIHMEQRPSTKITILR